MVFDPAADVTSMLADLKTLGLGVDVVLGVNTTKGIVDQEDVLEDELGITVQKRRTTLLIKTGSISPKVSDAITAGGVNYIVRSVDLINDGAITKLWLSRT